MNCAVRRTFVVAVALIAWQLVSREVEAIAIQDGLIHYWPMNEVSGLTLADSIGGANFQLQNGAQLGAPSISGSGAVLDRANDFLIASPIGLDFLGSDFTVSLWLRWTSAAGKPGILDFGPLAVDLMFGSLEPSLHIRQPAFRVSATSSATIADSNWHLLSIVRQGSTDLMYLDTNLVGSGAGALTTTSTGTLRVGVYESTHFFGGTIDDIAIYGRALTAAEICANAVPEPAVLSLFAVAVLTALFCRRRKSAGLAVFVVLASARPLPATIIDDFSVGPLSIEVQRYETESIAHTNLSTSNVLGGSRFVTLNGLGPSPASSVRVAVDNTAHKFRYDADAGATAANFVVRYGHNNGLQADLSADGSNAFVWDFAFANFETGQGNFDIVIEAELGRRYLYVPVASSASPFSLVLPYQAFSPGASSPNFAQVTKIEFGTANGNLRGDFALTAFRTAYYPDGDYNLDGSVNGLDYSLWRSHVGNGGPYGTPYPVDPADGNRSGIVDAADYVLWRKHVGAAANGAVAAFGVPEPVSICQTLVSLVAFACRRKSVPRNFV